MGVCEKRPNRRLQDRHSGQYVLIVARFPRFFPLPTPPFTPLLKGKGGGNELGPHRAQPPLRT